MKTESTFAGALVDMDGTLYRGSAPIPGAREGVRTLREHGIAVQFLTNNATSSREAYVEKLAGMGIDAVASDVVTSGVVTADYLAREHADDRAYVVGAPALFAELDTLGVETTDDPAAAEVVVLSLDPALDYELFTGVLRAVTSGPETPIVATNPDRTKPGTDGIEPSAGLVIGGVEGMTGRSPDRIAGKPSETTARYATARLDVDAADCVVVGDRLDTDIELGARAGMTTVLVRTGVTSDLDLDDADPQPDYVLDSIADVASILD